MSAPSPLSLTDDMLWGNPLGDALAAGRLVATLQSKLTGSHITVQFRPRAKVAGRWRAMPLHVATHVFIDVPNPSSDFNDRIGTLYPPHAESRWAGYFYPDRHADPARVWAAMKVLAIATGNAPMETDQYLVVLSERCLRCGRELTEPESIEAQMGPRCRDIVSAEYGRRHAAKAKAAALAEQPSQPVLVPPAIEPVPSMMMLDTSRPLAEQL